MPQEVSIAIESSCRLGGVALGLGEKLAESLNFDASARHAAQLVPRLDELLRRHNLRPIDVNHVYISAGPGSFTGLRLGITVTRTLAQMVSSVKCVAVPTTWAVAEKARQLPWQNLAVVLDVKEGLVYAALFSREGEKIVPQEPAGVMSPAELLAKAPRPLLISGEGLGYHSFGGEGVQVVDASLQLPTVESVWRVGRQLAGEGKFVEYHQLLPIYARKSEAERVWEAKHGVGEKH